MPLSRYRAGDYVPHSSGQVGGAPLPVGGRDAGERRERYVDETQRLMMTLPEEIGTATWNESSEQAPRFFTIASDGFEALRLEGRRLDKRPTLGAILGAKRYQSHVARARIFLPVLFEGVFDRAGDRYGSSHTLVKELGMAEWSARAAEAANTMRRAARESVELRLPLIIASDL